MLEATFVLFDPTHRLCYLVTTPPKVLEATFVLFDLSRSMGAAAFPSDPASRDLTLAEAERLSRLGLGLELGLGLGLAPIPTPTPNLNPNPNPDPEQPWRCERHLGACLRAAQPPHDSAAGRRRGGRRPRGDGRLARHGHRRAREPSTGTLTRASTGTLTRASTGTPSPEPAQGPGARATFPSYHPSHRR